MQDLRKIHALLAAALLCVGAAFSQALSSGTGVNGTGGGRAVQLGAKVTF